MRHPKPSTITVIARILAGVALGATILPLSRTGRGFVRIWDFPRAQIVTAAVAALAGLKWKSTRTTANDLTQIALAFCVTYHLRRIFPYTRAHATQMLSARGGSPDEHIRLLIANVYMDNRRYDSMRGVVVKADADVVCLVEPDEAWATEMACIEEQYPFTQKCPLDNTYGMLLYSRLPLSDVETRFIVADGIPSMRASVKLRSGQQIVLYCVHPRPPRPNSPTYGRDAELVLVGREVDRERRPSIIIGDLNDVAWSYTTTLFQKISHTVDPRVGRGMYNSFNAHYPFLRYPLDHVFATRDFTLVSLERLDNTGSDHFPMCVELRYNPRTFGGRQMPRMTPYDRQQAKEIVADARERGLAHGE